MHANVVPTNRIAPYTGAFWYAYAASAAYPQNSSTMANTPSTPERHTWRNAFHQLRGVVAFLQLAVVDEFQRAVGEDTQDAVAVHVNCN